MNQAGAAGGEDGSAQTADGAHVQAGYVGNARRQRFAGAGDQHLGIAGVGQAAYQQFGLPLAAAIAASEIDVANEGRCQPLCSPEAGPSTRR